MLMASAHVCGVTSSILGQPWRWRGGGAADDADPGFQPDDLVDRLLLARGVGREDLARHRAETQLGARFDVRRFHDAVLRNGSVPLDVLESEIDTWIAAERAR